MTQLSDLPRCRAFPEHLLDGITWHDVNHQKDEREYEPERRECQQESFEKVASHLWRESKILRPLVSNLWRAGAHSAIPKPHYRRRRFEDAEF